MYVECQIKSQLLQLMISQTGNASFGKMVVATATIQLAFCKPCLNGWSKVKVLCQFVSSWMAPLGIGHIAFIRLRMTLGLSWFACPHTAQTSIPLRGFGSGCAKTLHNVIVIPRLRPWLMHVINLSTASTPTPIGLFNVYGPSLIWTPITKNDWFQTDLSLARVLAMDLNYAKEIRLLKLQPLLLKRWDHLFKAFSEK